MTIKVNILPKEKERPWSVDPLTIVLFLALLAGNLAMVAYGKVLSGRVVDSRTEVSRLEGEARKQEEMLPVLTQREERIHKLETQIVSIKSLKDDPLRYSHLLSMVAQALPESIWLENLAIEPGNQTVSLSGSVAGPLPMGTLATLVQTLRKSQVFDHTELKTAVRQDHVFTFQLEAHYRPDAAVKEL
jgi:Tfp pilus assembly protein PilN